MPRNEPSRRVRLSARQCLNIGLVMVAVSLMFRFGVGPVYGQAQGDAWSQPYRLSTENGRASEAECVADTYGFVHCFWIETLYADGRNVIEYARFDGAAWSSPNSIYVVARGIANVAPAIDAHGVLHLAWTEGLTGPAFYAYAPAAYAYSAQSWSRPVRIDIPAGIVRLRVDLHDTLQVLYINRGTEMGVFHVSSDDHGATWSEAVWLDSDIPADHTPASLNFEVDASGGLHAVWYYGALNTSAYPDWVRYTNSTDGGQTWSTPFTIDRAAPESGYNLTSAGPILAVQGHSVYVIWAAGNLPYRQYRFSSDGGQTWSDPKQIFGALHGQAGDGLAVDGIGRPHFLGQIRYPIAIYHSYLDQAEWTSPSLVYQISQGDSETDFGDRIHAHALKPVVRAGNQLILTFTDPPAEPNRRLFAMNRLLDGVPPLEPVPTPGRTATPVSEVSPTVQSPTPVSTLTATPALIDTTAPLARGSVPVPAAVLQFALLPPLLLLGGTMLVKALARLRH